MRWTVLLPAKALPGAKSRLFAELETSSVSGEPPADAHRRLVHAIRLDTLAAAHEAHNVGRVVVIADHACDPATAGDQDPAAAGRGPVHVLVQSEPGLNSALREGAAFAASRWPGDGVAALVADLPALRAEELAAALAAAAVHARAFVADAAGTGTTLLTAGPHTDLLPEFGAGSATRHAATAAALPAGPGLRQDVDTGADLRAAVAIGLGPATRRVVPPGLVPFR